RRRRCTRSPAGRRRHARRTPARVTTAPPRPACACAASTARRGAPHKMAGMDDRPAHVVIVRGGFAGLWAARALARAPVPIPLLGRNHHLFQPLLYQVATAGLSAPDIAAPLRRILRRQRNVEVQMATVSRVDAQAREVELEHAGGRRRLGYDYLVLATGATHAYFGNE